VGGTQIENVLHDQRLAVGGSQVEAIASDRSEVVGRDHAEEIKRDRRVTVHGQDSRTVQGPFHDTVEKDYLLHVNGYHDVAVGLGAKKGKGTYYVRGDYFVGAAGVVKIAADKGLVLECGDSTIEITSSRIKISAPELVLSGKKSAELSGNGPSLSLGDKAELVAKELTILTPHSSLVLAEDAKLKGKRVLLNCDGPKQPQSKPETAEEQTQAFKLTVKDPDLTPYGGKRYALLVDGKTYEGETTGSGDITQKIPTKAERADLTVWIDEWPTGRKLTWHFELGDLPDMGSVEGVQARLENLGYYQGQRTGKLDDVTVAALRWFQRDHGLKETGEVDQATQSALAGAHGH
jgi:type VI secretion system secreted protein VgrG